MVRPERKRIARRPNRTEPFVVSNGRDAIEAAAAKTRMIRALSEIAGLCRGLEAVDYGMAISLLSESEAKSFARQAKALSAMLKKASNHIEEASRNGSQA